MITMKIEIRKHSVNVYSNTLFTGRPTAILAGTRQNYKRSCFGITPDNGKLICLMVSYKELSILEEAPTWIFSMISDRSFYIMHQTSSVIQASCADMKVPAFTKEKESAQLV